MKPSVSKLIQLLDKPALLKWANNIGLQGIKLDEYRKKSLADGTSIHSQIERFIKHQVLFDKEEHQNNFNNYFANKKIIDNEKNIETEYFVGRYDIKIEYNEKTFICDFKSNQSNIYFENKLQLTAYRMAEDCDGVGIISVPDFRFIPVPIKDFVPYEQILISLSNIYNLKITANEISY